MQNGSVIGEETVYPNFVKYSCDDGFVLRGPSKIKCQANGTWSKTLSFCEGKYLFIPLSYPPLFHQSINHLYWPTNEFYLGYY